MAPRKHTSMGGMEKAKEVLAAVVMADSFTQVWTRGM